MQFTLRFPSGFSATRSSGYNSHKSQFLRLQGALGWAEPDPGYAYEGNRLRYGLLKNGREAIHEPSNAASDQFMLEIDHMSQSVRQDRQPRLLRQVNSRAGLSIAEPGATLFLSSGTDQPYSRT